MLVQQVDVARLDRPDFAVGQGLYLAFTFITKYRFIVIFVMNVRLSARKNAGDMERETCIIVGQNKARAVPITVFSSDQAICFTCFFEITNDHKRAPLRGSQLLAAYSCKGRNGV